LPRLTAAATCPAIKAAEAANRPQAGGDLPGRPATLYTKIANRSKLAAGAIGKLDRAETENRTSIPAPSAEVRAEIRKSE
jgi:hypothetical protein